MAGGKQPETELVRANLNINTMIGQIILDFTLITVTLSADLTVPHEWQSHRATTVDPLFSFKNIITLDNIVINVH